MFWDKIAHLYDLFENVYNGKVYTGTGKKVAKFIEPTDKVLECACGTGAISIYIAPKEIWDAIGKVYESMPYWQGYDEGPHWKDENEIDLVASVEPGGLQIFGTMPDDIWEVWYMELTDNEDKTKIRANQGHSIDVDVELEEKEPPEMLWYGTGDKNGVWLTKEVPIRYYQTLVGGNQLQYIGAMRIT